MKQFTAIELWFHDETWEEYRTVYLRGKVSNPSTRHLNRFLKSHGGAVTMMFEIEAPDLRTVQDVYSNYF